MTKHLRKRLLQTQPQHQMLSFQSESTQGNRSEAYLRPVSRARQTEPNRGWIKQISANSITPASQSRNSLNKTNSTAIRRKYHRNSAIQLRKQEPQLFSPFIGMKVRRAVQKDFEFHSSFTRDEVLNYFALPPKATIKKRAARNQEEFKKKAIQSQVYHKKGRQRVVSKEEERMSEEELSGWKVDSDCMVQSVIDQKSRQIVSNYPSISQGLAQDITDSLPRQLPSQVSSSAQPTSQLQLPEYSLKIVTPSEIESSLKDISIQIIKETLPLENSRKQLHSYSKVTQYKNNAASCSKVHSKMSLEPKSILNTDSQRHAGLNEKKTYESLHSNKENCVQVTLRRESPSVKQVNLPSKGCLRNLRDSGKVSVSYSEEYVCSQKLDENDGLGVSEREQTRAFKFDRANKPTAPPAVDAPVQESIKKDALVQESMKKEKKRKSAVMEAIQQFGSNCKNFFSNQADKIKPFCDKLIEQESDIAESILALRTLHSRTDVDSHLNPREAKVSIREPFLLETQSWAVDSMQIPVNSMEERMATVHEVRMSAKDFSSEVKIALTSHTQNREEFYSEEYLMMQRKECVTKALTEFDDKAISQTKGLIVLEVHREIEEYTGLLLDKMCFDGSEEEVHREIEECTGLLLDKMCFDGSKEEIRKQVALHLDFWQMDIMEKMLLA